MADSLPPAQHQPKYLRPALPTKRKIDPSTVDPVGRVESSRFLDSRSKLFRRQKHGGDREGQEKEEEQEGPQHGKGKIVLA